LDDRAAATEVGGLSVARQAAGAVAGYLEVLRGVVVVRHRVSTPAIEAQRHLT
jgi:hypothetical protein